MGDIGIFCMLDEAEEEDRGRAEEEKRKKLTPAPDIYS
jgi:hypothetical protein